MMVFLVESIEVGDLVLWVGDARAAAVDQFSCVLIVTDRPNAQFHSGQSDDQAVELLQCRITTPVKSGRELPQRQDEPSSFSMSGITSRRSPVRPALATQAGGGWVWCGQFGEELTDGCDQPVDRPGHHVDLGEEELSEFCGVWTLNAPLVDADNH